MPFISREQALRLYSFEFLIQLGKALEGLPKYTERMAYGEPPLKVTTPDTVHIDKVSSVVCHWEDRIGTEMDTMSERFIKPASFAMAASIRKNVGPGVMVNCVGIEYVPNGESFRIIKPKVTRRQDPRPRQRNHIVCDRG